MIDPGAAPPGGVRTGPSPLIVYEPAKRIFVGGLPHDATREEVIDFFRKRSRANPRNVELNLNADGTNKGYCHMSVEGMKNVVESTNGLVFRGQKITVAAAKAHYAYKLFSAKAAKLAASKPPTSEQPAAPAPDVADPAVTDDGEGNTADACADGDNDDVVIKQPTVKLTPPSRNFFDARKRFGVIASEVAKKFDPKRKSEQVAGKKRKAREAAKLLAATKSAATEAATADATATGAAPTRAGVRRDFKSATDRKRPRDAATAEEKRESRRDNVLLRPGGKPAAAAATPSAAAQAAPVAVAAPAPPTGEKKIASLKAKLEALKAKLAGGSA